MNKKLLCNVLLVLLVLILLSISLFADRVKPHNVTCECIDYECDKEIENLCLNFLDTRVINLKKEINKQLSQKQWIDSFRIESQKLDYKIVITYSKAKVTVRDVDKQPVCHSDCQGNCIPVNYSEDLPLLDTTDEFVGEYFSVSKYKNMIELLCKINEISQFKNSFIQNDGFYVILRNGYKLIFPVEIDDPDYYSGSLDLILSRLNNFNEDFKMNEVDKVGEIDMRYKHPYLR